MECESLQIQRSDNQVFQLPLEETEVNHNQWWSNQEEQISVFFDGARWNIHAMGAILKSEQTASTTPPSGTYFLTSSDGIDLNTLETVPTWDLSFECFDGFYEDSSFYFSDDDDVVESSVNDDEFESSESSEEFDSFDNFESSDDEDMDSSQAQLTIFTQICDCVVKHNACDGTCMDMFSYNDQECVALMAGGVCGGDIPTTMPYAQLCGLEFCPTAIEVSNDELDFSSSMDNDDDDDISVDFSDEVDDTFSSTGDDDFDVSVDEFDSFDAELVLYMQICDCVVKHNACDGTCLDMFDYEDQECAALMAGEICGGKLPTTMSYAELCGTAYCPRADDNGSSSDEFDSSVEEEESSDEFDSSAVAPEFESSDAGTLTTSDEPNDGSFESSVDDEFDSSSDEFDFSSVAATEFDSSDAGMVTTFESSVDDDEFDSSSVEEFSDEIDESSSSMDNNDDVDVSVDDFESSDADLPVETFLQICDCVVKHDACDGTCLDMFDYDDQECAAVMADGICGGDIPTTMSYSELCGTAYCPGETAFSTAFPTVMTTPSPTTITSSPTTTSTTTTAPSPTTSTTPPPTTTTTTMPSISTTTPPPATTTTTTAPSTTPTMTTTTVAPTVASSEPTVSTTISAAPTPSNEPAPVLVKTKLEMSVTRETFEAEKENYVEAFAASAGVDKSSVTMYLADDDDTEQSAARRVLAKRELLEALQVICDILTSAPEIVEDVVVSTDFVEEFNKELDQNILQQVFYTETITQAPTPQPPSDSANAVESGSTGSNMSMVLIAVALVVALCAVGVVYGVRGCVSPKVVVVKGSSLTNVQPRSSLSALYDEVEGDVEEHGTTKRGPSASVAANKQEEGSNWPRELYQNITREGDQITTDMENVL